MLKIRFTKPYPLTKKKVGDELVLKQHKKLPIHLVPYAEVVESDSEEAPVQTKKRKKKNEEEK